MCTQNCIKHPEMPKKKLKWKLGESCSKCLQGGPWTDNQTDGRIWQEYKMPLAVAKRDCRCFTVLLQDTPRASSKSHCLWVNPTEVGIVSPLCKNEQSNGGDISHQKCIFCQCAEIIFRSPATFWQLYQLPEEPWSSMKGRVGTFDRNCNSDGWWLH